MGPYNFLRKIIILSFAFLVFVTVYAVSSSQTFTISIFGKFFTINFGSKREVLPYMGVMLMITLVYLELLIIRDHLWLIEGSSREALRWRDTFFNKETLKMQKVRKIVVVLLSTVIFTYVYVTIRGTEIFSFLGIILMVTVLYFEVLSMRDDLRTLNNCFQNQEIENKVRRELEEKSAPTPSNGPPNVENPEKPKE